MRSAGKSDIGLVRKVNEDDFICLRLNDMLEVKDSAADLYLCIVADGMGGRNAGEVASSMAVKEIVEFIKEQYINVLLDENADDEKIFNLIKHAITYSNDKIYKKSLLTSECVGMGTTLSMILVKDKTLYYGHVGDSRIYLIRENQIKRLTEDHSLVAELVKQGSIKPEEAVSHPQKNIITRAVGTEYGIEVDLGRQDIVEGDYILLCTDGLSNLIGDDEILRLVLNAPDIEQACQDLIDKAKENGGFDNITVVVIEKEKGGDCNDR
ncbi:MAG: Stp1/IreP family PP2C-type Ser/Thr phosphatase [Clostridia bacterium]|jgi:protein phosphatase|nr:Stp1/IreP family PP2C-type Ser/Thr phosphatase [Clostridia bacterium]